MSRNLYADFGWEMGAVESAVKREVVAAIKWAFECGDGWISLDPSKDSLAWTVSAHGPELPTDENVWENPCFSCDLEGLLIEHGVHGDEVERAALAAILRRVLDRIG